MGWAGFMELYARKDRFDIRLLARDSKKNRKKLEPYLSDPSVTVIWGDLTRYEDVLAGVNGSDYVLHVGGMVSPAADYFPEKNLESQCPGCGECRQGSPGSTTFRRCESRIYRLGGAVWRP